MQKNSKNIFKENNALNFFKKFSKNIVFKHLISENNLKIARIQIKNQLKKILMFYLDKNNEILVNVSKKWFFSINQFLLKGNFQYPKQKLIFNLNKKNVNSFFIINNIRIKIIEKAILNGLDKIFEGIWYWKPINEKNYLIVWTLMNGKLKHIKKNKNGWFLKSWKQKPKLYRYNYKFKLYKSIHNLLKEIVKWKNNTYWIIKYTLFNIFNIVNKKRLFNICLKKFNEPVLWIEIEKIIHIKFRSNIKTSIYNHFCLNNKNNTLIVFLYNIYINEFDKFIYYLILDYKKSKICSTFSEMLQKYHNYSYNIKAKFLNKSLIKQFQKVLNKKKKNYYNKYTYYKLQKGQILQYTRYYYFFFIGIIGSYVLALKTKQKIDRFLKSDLHLKIEQNNIIKKNDNSITFFNFILYFPKFNKKINKKWNHIFKIVEYKKKVFTQLKQIPKKYLIKNIISIIKKDLLKAFNKKLKSKKWNLKTINIFSKIIIKQKNKYKINYKKLFTKNVGTTLNFYNKYIYNIFKLIKNKLLSADKIKNLKNNFIENLKKIIKHKNLYIEKTENSNKNFTILQQKINIKFSLKKIWINFSNKGFLQKKKCQPITNKFLCFNNNYDIIKNYSYVMNGLLFYYKPVNNIWKIKKLIEKLKQSCILTLKTKHNKNLKWVFKIFSKNIKQFILTNCFIKLPVFTEICNINRGFFLYKTLEIDINDFKKKFIYKIIKKNQIFFRCCFYNCNNKNIEIQYYENIKYFILNILFKTKLQIKEIYFVIYRKQLPICSKHFLKYEN